MTQEVRQALLSGFERVILVRLLLSFHCLSTAFHRPLAAFHHGSARILGWCRVQHLRHEI